MNKKLLYKTPTGADYESAPGVILFDKINKTIKVGGDAMYPPFQGVSSEGSVIHTVTAAGDLEDYTTITNPDNFIEYWGSTEKIVLMNSTFFGNDNSLFYVAKAKDVSEAVSALSLNTDYQYRTHSSNSLTFNVGLTISEEQLHHTTLPVGSAFIDKYLFVDWMNVNASLYWHDPNLYNMSESNTYQISYNTDHWVINCLGTDIATTNTLSDLGIIFTEDVLDYYGLDETALRINLYYSKNYSSTGYYNLSSGTSLEVLDSYGNSITSKSLSLAELESLNLDWLNIEWGFLIKYDPNNNAWIAYQLQCDTLCEGYSGSFYEANPAVLLLILSSYLKGVSINLAQYYEDNSISRLDTVLIETPILTFTGSETHGEAVSGKLGLVPAPQVEDDGKFLCADGTWKELEVAIDDFNSNSGGGGSASIEFDGNLAPYATVTDITKYQQNGIYNIPNIEKTYLEYIENPAVTIYYKTKISGLFDNYITGWQTTYPSADNAIVTNIVKNYLYGYSSEYTLVGESSPNQKSSFGHIYSTDESATISALISANIISDMGTYSSDTVYFTYDYMNVCWNISTTIGGTILSTTFDLSDYSISSDLDMSEYTTYYFSFTVVLNDVSSNVDLYQGNTWVASDANPLTIDYTDNILNGELDLDNDVITIPFSYDQFNDLEAVENMLGIQLSNIDPSITEGELEIEYTSTSSYHNGLVPAPENNNQVLVSTGWKNVWTGTETEYNNVNWDSSNPMLDTDTGIEYYTIYVTED